MPRCAMEVAATSNASSADVLHHRGEQRRAGAPVQLGGVDDRVDDLRADVGDRRRQHAGNQREHGERDAERLVGGPHEIERAAAVGEHTEQAALQAARVGRRRRLAERTRDMG